MVAGRSIRLSKLAREFNVGIHTIVESLHKKGIEIDSNPNTKVTPEAVQLLEKEYKVDISIKRESEKISLKSHRPKKEVISIDNPDGEPLEETTEEPVPEVKVEKPKEVVQEKPIEEVTRIKKEDNVKVLGKIDLDQLSRPKKKPEKPKTIQPSQNLRNLGRKINRRRCFKTRRDRTRDRAHARDH